MEYLFICYKSCSTCAKAKKSLEANNINYTYREISDANPSVEELKAWIKLSGLPIKKFFNTSGKIYRELKLKEKLKYMTDLEKIQLLATDGMLVKRPLLVSQEKVLVGFDEEKYQKLI
ncbi:MAG: arsenate reductase family protein [Erysipelothrix sp.]|nr:arsenate reductase family protein [Erysipelothrix sp.]